MDEQLAILANSVYAGGQTEADTQELLEVGRSIIEVRRLSHNKPTFWVNFDDAYKWLGYTRKDNAKRKLESRLAEGIDYSVSLF